MTKAEERALEECPVDMTRIPYQDLIEFYGGKTEIDFNVIPRTYFLQGYQQAEQDLALTIQDLELLHTFLYAVKNNKHGCFTFTRLSDEQYIEVLKRYLEAKNNG